eukprot:TRINITY_DN29596_c0_g1_i1.p1 TRINITY_DN29596_c0_g1~~TRINITY_DN29596_c0_g1_i1.p1  ORF type:complete len:881 (+),score=262.12 TRINITY_DN29596_c0_g1_i1:68-2710(+)
MAQAPGAGAAAALDADGALAALLRRGGRGTHSAGAGPWQAVLLDAKAAAAARGAECAQLASAYAEQYAARGEEGVAAAAQAVCAIYLWVTSLLAHPLAGLCCAVEGLPAPPPLGAPDQGEEWGAGRPRPALLRPGDLRPAPDNPFLSAYTTWARGAAGRLLAAARLCGAPPPALLNEVTHESLQLRREWAWSVPTEAALGELARQAPLLEVGAGSGYWATILRGRGVDVVALDSSEDWRPALNPLPGEGARAECRPRSDVVQRGGPEAVGEHGAGRALVLMWPDFSGHGTFAAECLRRYEGSTLVLVGEWRGCTLGQYAAELPPTGQSFAPGVQLAVEQGFELVTTIALPRWPLHADVLSVWHRREQAEPSAWSVEETAHAGRALTAAHPLRQGEVVLREEPLAHVRITRDPALSRFVQIYESAAAAGGLRRLLCSGLQQQGTVPAAAQACADVEARPDAHADFVGDGARAAELELVGAVAAVFHYNGFGGELQGEDGQTVLELRAFADASMCNHSCRPTAAIAPRDGVVWALVDTPAGGAVTLSYLADEQLLLPAPARRARLAERWGFECGCERCSAAADDVRRFRAVRRVAAAALPPHPGALEYSDPDGDSIAIAPADGYVTYSVDGEARPPCRELRLTPDGSGVDFVDIDRAVDLPADPAQRVAAVAQLVRIAAAAGVAGQLPSEVEVSMCECGGLWAVPCGVARATGAAIVLCCACGGPLPAEDAAALLAAETGAAAARRQTGGGALAELAAFARAHPQHHLSCAAAAALAEAAPDAAEAGAWRGRRAEGAAALAEATCGAAAVAAHLADLYAEWSEALMRAGDVEGAQRAFSEQARCRALGRPPGEDAAEWADGPSAAEVAAIAPPAEVLSFLFN